MVFVAVETEVFQIDAIATHISGRGYLITALT
jgi:hypothetical protein